MKKIKNQSSINKRVQQQYDAFPFPGRDYMSKEGLQLLHCLQEWLQSESPHGESAIPRVIDVGCGTGDLLISLARHFPEIEFLGIDRSQRSLVQGRDRASAQHASNVAFKKTDISEDLSHLGTFRVVISTGVLHHVPDMASAIRNVSALLEPHGHLLVWLYGRYGRFYHRLNQEFLRMLCHSAPLHEQKKVARAFIQHLGKPFAIQTGFHTPHGSGTKGLEWLLENPVWLVDQMVPGYESNVTIADILDLLEQNDLTLSHWLGMPTDLQAYTSSRLLLNRFRRLSRREQTIALDCLTKPPYYFIAAVRNHNPESVT